MKNRRRNNIIIGILCCAVIFMSVGYAILSTTLNIGATANIKGDFDIHFLTDDDEYTEAGVLKRGISLIDYENSTSSNTVYKTTVSSLAPTMEASTGVDTQDPTEASFTAILQKPTDYATFTAIAKNYGTIKGIISSVNIVSTPSQELTTWLSTNGGTYSDYFEVTTTAAQNTVLNPNGEYEFTITVRFKQSADKLPQGALNNEITITYQQVTESPSGGSTPVSSDGWIVDANGKVTHSPSSAIQNGVLRIPAVDQNGNNIVSIDQSSFEPEHNVVYYYTSEGSDYVIITDQINYERLRILMGKMEFTIISNVDQIPSGEEVEQNVYFNIDSTTDVEDFDWDDIQISSLDATVLDLSDAIYLSSIGNDTFMMGSIEEIKFNNAITSIGFQAFANCKISSLTIPSTLQSIGAAAFASNGLSTLNLENASSLISIGDGAFNRNNLSELDFSGASNLTTIGESAFNQNIITNLNLTGLSRLTTIGDYAFEKQQNDMQSGLLTQINISDTSKTSFLQRTLGNEWFDPNGNPTIIFSDYTCSGNLNSCTAN